MNVLIVYAHPEPRSFNGAMVERARSVLGGLGHHVEVSDLHAMDFRAVAGRGDFLEVADAAFFKYAAEQAHAVETGTFAPDIAAEHEKLIRADLLILQFPMWWFSVPAILKGWVDRVFAAGFAYGGKVGWYDEGPFRTKRALLSVTTGAPLSAFARDGLDGWMDIVLWPIQNGMLNFTGFKVLAPFIAPAPARADAAERARMLDDYATRLRNLDGEEPLFFHPLSDFDMESKRLKSHVAPGTPGQPGRPADAC